MFNPALFSLFSASQKSPEQKEEEARQKTGDDFARTLENMTSEEQRNFWKQHDRDTSSKTLKNHNPQMKSWNAKNEPLTTKT